MKFSFPNFSKFRFTNWTLLCWSHDDNCPDWFFTLARTANRVQVATYLPPCPHTCLQFYFENKRFFVSLLSSIAFYSAILCQVLRTFVCTVLQFMSWKMYDEFYFQKCSESILWTWCRNQLPKWELIALHAIESVNQSGFRNIHSVWDFVLWLRNNFIYDTFEWIIGFVVLHLAALNNYHWARLNVN